MERPFLFKLILFQLYQNDFSKQISNDSKRNSVSKNLLCDTKSQIGYKSVERKKRKYEEIWNTKFTYEYRKDSLWNPDIDNKENSINNSSKILESCERFNSAKENYTTPPFKSYKSKITEKEGKDITKTTSYRSRSNAYNDSTRSSLNIQPRKSRDSAIEEDSTPSYIAHKDYLLGRREIHS